MIKQQRFIKRPKQNLEQATTDLAYTVLKAPFDGVIASTSAKQFQSVGATQPVLNIQNTEKLEVSFNVPVSLVKEMTLDELKKQNFSIYIDSFKDINLPSKIKSISTQPDRDTNSYLATLEFNRPGRTQYCARYDRDSVCRRKQLQKGN